jgi:hypothetical protein
MKSNPYAHGARAKIDTNLDQYEPKIFTSDECIL